ncbi:Hypothetical predicted protein [Pelobates cultripes]|uniref:Uncharacterized protein n=1 Tax=Pelobates cultripes TaxID=61616 RepID=A0AAD1R6E7_PELCU|nr:Hypothetical predicted protein [Pelobates cultripes]
MAEHDVTTPQAARDEPHRPLRCRPHTPRSRTHEHPWTANVVGEGKTAAYNSAAYSRCKLNTCPN